MDFHGNINLQDNLMKKMVFEPETAFPGSPSNGRVAYVNKRLWMYVSSVGWLPLTTEINMYVHIQESSSASWTVTHNLNFGSPLVMVYDSNNQIVLPDTITPSSKDQISITFSTVTTGRAVVMKGAMIGNVAAPQVVEATFSSSSTWTVNHYMGTEPIVRVFVGNEEIQPVSIIHNNLNTTTITFSMPLSGTVRLIG